MDTVPQQYPMGDEARLSDNLALSMSIDLPPLPPLPTAPARPNEIVPVGGVLYKVNSSRASFGELRRDSRGAHVLLAWLSKLMRMRLPGSVNDPNVEALRPFEVEETTVPKDVLERIQPLLAQLQAAGFDATQPICHWIVDLFNNSRCCIVTLARPDRRAVARVFLRMEGAIVPPKTHLFCDLLSELQDGRFIWTTGARSTLDAPATMQVTREVNAPPARLWAIHQQTLDRLPLAAGIRRTSSREQVVEMLERHHVQARDFHLKRKLFTPMSVAEVGAAAAINAAYSEGFAAGTAYPEIFAEMERLQNKQTSWLSGLVVLGITLLLFVAAEAGGGENAISRGASRELLVILIGVLFFHELGHYLAMRIFHYRNVRMFFIPFLGAAVSGVNYSAPGWKKVIVALMGPLPGIVIGGGLGIAGILMHQTLLVKIALMSMILNGFNLLPVLPLDGGRVVQTLLFSRHYAADVIFRAVAGLALLVTAVFIHSRWFTFMGVLMLMGIPMTWWLGRIAAGLRRSGLEPPPVETQKIPPELANAIISRLKGGLQKRMKANNKQVARNALVVYETMRTRPPGWLATIGFGALHLGSAVLALVLAMVFFVAPGGSLRDFARAAARQPQYSVSPAEIVVAPGPSTSADALPTPRKTIIANFTKRPDATSAFEDFRPRLASGESLERFGQTLMVSFPASDDEARKRWLAAVRVRTKDFCVDGSDAPFGGASLRLMCVTPDDSSAQQLQDELNEYFEIPVAMALHLIPPWSPFAVRSSGQWEQYRLARRTYQKLVRAGQSDGPDDAMQALNRRQSEAMRLGDNAEVKKIMTDRNKLYDQRRQAELDRLGNLRDGSVDIELVRQFRKLPQREGNAEDEDADASRYDFTGPVYQAMAVRMGQIELVSGKPSGGSDRYCARFGSANRTGLLLHLPFIGLEDPAEGAPAIIRWLDSRGCKGIKYQFNLGAMREQPF